MKRRSRNLKGVWPAAFVAYFEKGIKPSDNADSEGAMELFLLLRHPSGVEALKREYFEQRRKTA